MRLVTPIAVAVCLALCFGSHYCRESMVDGRWRVEHFDGGKRTVYFTTTQPSRRDGKLHFREISGVDYDLAGEVEVTKID